MEITAVTRAKGTRYRIEVDGAYWYILDEEIIATYHLYAGEEVTPELLEEAKTAADRRKARERALYLLEYRDHGKRELVEKLKKSVSPEIAEETADRMEELGLLDDEVYAAKLAEQYLNQKRWGRRRAEQQLRMKGFDRELISRALDDAENDPVENILYLIQRKYRAKLSEENGKQKTVQALLRQGYNYDDIRTAFARLHEEDWQ